MGVYYSSKFVDFLPSGFQKVSMPKCWMFQFPFTTVFFQNIPTVWPKHLHQTADASPEFFILIYLVNVQLSQHVFHFDPLKIQEKRVSKFLFYARRVRTIGLNIFRNSSSISPTPSRNLILMVLIKNFAHAQISNSFLPYWEGYFTKTFKFLVINENE